VKGIAGDEKRLLEALIWERCGDLARRLATVGTGCPCAACRRARKLYTDVVRPGAEVCYRKSIELDPHLLSSQKKLLSLLQAQKKRKEAEQTAREIVERWPGEVDALLFLGDSSYQRKAYGKAERHFKLALGLEPLNARIIARLEDCSVASARRRARGGRFELARADFLKAEGLMRGALAPRHQVVWAAVESAAGGSARAEALLQSAVATGLWEVEAWWRLAAALHEFEAPPGMLASALAKLQELLARADLDPASVARAAAFHAAIKEESLFWPGAVAFRSMLRKHLKRARKAPLNEAQRIEVCHLFRSLGDLDLVAAYALAGRKAHPTSYQFPLLEAMALLEAGAASLDGELLGALSQARAGARKAGDDESLRKIEAILAFHRRFDGSPPRLVQRLFAFLGGRAGSRIEEGEDNDEENHEDNDADKNDGELEVKDEPL
jgi:tetratricopeptide (TPR) repeat protein